MGVIGKRELLQRDRGFPAVGRGGGIKLDHRNRLSKAVLDGGAGLGSKVYPLSAICRGPEFL